MWNPFFLTTKSSHSHWRRGGLQILADVLHIPAATLTVTGAQPLQNQRK